MPYTAQNIRRVFISAPFRGTTPWAVEQSCRLVDEVCADVSVYSSGRAIAIAAHRNSRHFIGLMPDEYWMAAYSNILSMSHAVLFVGDWRNSSGCLAEHHTAKDLGIPIYYSVNILIEDLTQGVI